jgi:hypothetical protein
MGNAAEFIKFQRPHQDINARSWKDRLRALEDGHKNKWAMYGPFKTYKSASNAKSSVNKYATQLEFNVYTSIEGNENREYFLFITVRDR